MMSRIFAAALFVVFSAAVCEAQAPSIEERYVGILMPTEAERPETAALVELQQGHLANMRRMAEAGILLVAGPTRPLDVDMEAIAGIWVFASADEELIALAEEMMADDPLIAAGYLRVETYVLFFETGDNLYERRPRSE